MKKLRSVLLCALVLTLCCACNDNRNKELKIYNWSCYIADGVLDDFKVWYKEQTGEDIKVIYQTFDINETMLTKIARGHEDFDVVCPSDYIIERMLNNGLLQPLDFSAIPESENYIKQNRSPFIEQTFNKINPTINANDYSVAYMWGTVGLLYNTAKISEEEVSSWNAVRNPKFAGKILIKDSPRDMFSPILMLVRQKEISEGSVTIDELMYDSSDESIAAVEDFFKQVTPLVAGWETDFGKEQMTQERAWLSMNWSGDAVWAIEEGRQSGVELNYSIPVEGSNIWFDGWVIPKYAKNVKAATMFINFMCRPDIAIRNMEQTGYVAANGSPEVLEAQIDTTCAPIDISYFFGPQADSVNVCPIFYPDKKTIERCALMHDWGDKTDKLITMWSRVKGEQADSSTVIVIITALVAGIGVGVWNKIKQHRRKTKHKRKQRSRLS